MLFLKIVLSLENKEIKLKISEFVIFFLQKFAMPEKKCSDIFQFNFEYPPNSRFICQTFSYSIPTGTQSFRE